MMRAVFTLAAFLATVATASAQSSVNIRASDSSTGVTTQVGDATNFAIRVSSPTLATAAHQVTEHSYVDGLETLIGTTNTTLTAIAASDVIISGISVLQGTTTAGQRGALTLGAVSSANPGYAPASTNALSMTTQGGLRVAIIEGAGTGGFAAADNATFTANTSSSNPIMGVYEASPTTVTSGRFGSVGITATRQLKATFYSAAGVEAAFSQDVQEDASEVSAVYGPLAMTVRRDVAASSAGATAEYAVLNTNGQGRLYTASVNEATALVTNSMTPHFLATLATDNATLVKNAPGNVYNYHLTNTTATPYYLRMYNRITAPTCSSATDFVKSILIPANTSGAGIVVPLDLGEGYSVGIAYCVTTTAAPTGSGAAAAGVLINLGIK